MITFAYLQAKYGAETLLAALEMNLTAWRVDRVCMPHSPPAVKSSVVPRYRHTDA